MTARPEDVPQWATDGAADIVEPSLGKKEIGWANDEEPPAGFFNWWKNLSYRWHLHYQELALHNWIWGYPAVGGPYSAQPLAMFSGLSSAGGSRAWCCVGAVLGGTAPLVLASDDGQTVVLNQSGVSVARDLNAGVYDPSNAAWIAVGNADPTDAYIITTPNPVSSSWTHRANPKNVSLLACATDGAGVVVAGGDYDGADLYIVRSTDGGATWSEQTNPGVFNDRIYGMTHNGTNFVAVGEDPSSNPMIMTSPDGVAWTKRTPAGGSVEILRAVAYDGTATVAVGDNGETQRSTDDGVSWSLVASPAAGDFGHVAADPAVGVFVARTDSEENLYSVDHGVTWALSPVQIRANVGGPSLPVGASPGGFMTVSRNRFEGGTEHWVFVRSLMLR